MLKLTKTFRIWVERQRLARDARKALAYAQETYWNELSLPEDERDQTLMDETLSVIQCASSVLAKGARRAPLKLFSSCSTPLRRAMTVVAVCILVIALSAGATYAMGVDVWQLLFKTESGHAALYKDPSDSVDSDPQKRPFPSIEPTKDFVDYESVADACDALSLDPMLISDAYPDAITRSVYGMADEMSISLFVEYETDKSFISYMTVRYPDEDTAILLTAEGFDAAAETVTFDGITFYIVRKEAETLIMWSSECYAYEVTTDIPCDDFLKALEESFA